jgi:hypothetical protein
MLAVAFNTTSPFTSADFPIDLAVNFFNEIVLVTVVMKHVLAAGFASKNCFPVTIEKAPDIGVNEHGVAVRAECPRICGIPRYV